MAYNNRTGFYMGRFSGEGSSPSDSKRYTTPELSSERYTTPENLVEQLEAKLSEAKDFEQEELRDDEFTIDLNKEEIGQGAFGVVRCVEGLDSLAAKTMGLPETPLYQKKKVFQQTMFQLNLVMRLQYGNVAAGCFQAGSQWHFTENGTDLGTANFVQGREILNELRTLQAHPGYKHLHHILHVTFNYPNCTIFSERCDGDLIHLIQYTPKGFVWADLVSQLGNAMNYIHFHSMAHLDIKPDNVLYKGNRFLLTDFDTLSAMDYGIFAGGSNGYVPPSVVHNICIQSEGLWVWLRGVDYYAFCVTVLKVHPKLLSLMRNFEIKMPETAISSDVFKSLAEDFYSGPLTELGKQVKTLEDTGMLTAAYECILAAHDLGTSRDVSEMNDAAGKQCEAMERFFTAIHESST